MVMSGQWLSWRHWIQLCQTPEDTRTNWCIHPKEMGTPDPFEQPSAEMHRSQQHLCERSVFYGCSNANLVVHPATRMAPCELLPSGRLAVALLEVPFPNGCLRRCWRHALHWWHQRETAITLVSARAAPEWWAPTVSDSCSLLQRETCRPRQRMVSFPAAPSPVRHWQQSGACLSIRPSTWLVVSAMSHCFGATRSQLHQPHGSSTRMLSARDEAAPIPNRPSAPQVPGLPSAVPLGFESQNS
mmetsp:Transcript_39842/g.105630  ORF Transcript_39842/g.105630 Transcript_39842/m.105630 type:complete len:243 (+) Transcript_39842:876-1604(+)